MNDAGVPATVEDLYDRYDRLITWAIYRTSCRKLTTDQVQDLRQQVYLQVLERNYLTTCQTFYQTHTGKFSSSLYVLVRNLVIHRFDRQRADVLGPAKRQHTAAYSHMKDGRPQSIDRWDDAHSIFGVSPSPEGPVEARNLLDVIGCRLDRSKRRSSVRALIEAALNAGGDLHSQRLAEAVGANASTVRHYLVSMRAEARRLEDPAWLTDATKSAPKSSARKSTRGRSSSGKRPARPALSA